jgi:hypothetical protein
VTPPVAVFRETQVRTFEYTVLVPDDPGYDGMKHLTLTLKKIGKGHPRVLANAKQVRGQWPECPLLEQNGL